MKNLRLQSIKAVEHPDLPNTPWFCVSSDPGSPSIFFCHATTIYRYSLNLEQLLNKYTLDVPDESVQVVGFVFTSLWNKLYVALSNGEVACLEDDEISYLGGVESGIKAIEWSVDESLVVLVTGNDTVLLLSADFDPVTEEVDLYQDGFGEKQFVNVGWGKKETQFHGSEGKAAAKANMQVEEKPAGEFDDGSPKIRWRGDGALFAVSFVKRNSGARQIRIFNREGALQFTSEPTVGLENSLDWKLSGGVIASTIRLPNKHVVGFFEKNGLRHGDFTLPFKPNEVQVKKLSWNLDSSILAVWCVFNEKQESCLQLWAASNYNWQLKQALTFPEGQALLAFAWDKELMYNLHVVQEGMRYTEYVWKWGVDHSQGCLEDDLASVAVIDGGQVKMTNFKEAVVPPPMCAYTLNLPNPVSCVSFGPSRGSSNDVCIVTSANEIATFSLNEPSAPASDLISASIPDEGLGFANSGTKLCPLNFCKLQWGAHSNLKFRSLPSSLHHWLMISSEILVCVMPAEKAKSCLLKVVLEKGAAKVESVKEVNSVIRGLALTPDGAAVVINLTNDCLKVFSLMDESISDFSTNNIIQFSCFSKCNQFNIFDVEGDLHVIGRNFMGLVYLNNVDIMKNCSSYYLHSHFMLFTTTDHKLLCIPKTKDGIELLMNRSKAGPDETERQIENGAVLVSAVSCGTRVVLQMPRGNLEAIQPRALAIFIIKHMLDSKKYAGAFDIMRKQRINLNLIFDHNPQLFMDNIKEFVQQIKNPSWLCLFLMDLMETDVTQSMYAGHYPNKQLFLFPNGMSKLDFISKSMRETLQSVDKDGLLLPIISSYIKETTSNVGAALQCINDAKMEEHKGSKLAVSSDEALNYLFYIVDVYELFDVALGLYDFELVMLVAQKSQKDPKEYIPFLNELRKLEPKYRKFVIDKHLKKYDLALKSLKECGPEHFAECMKFITDQKLHSNAIKLFSSTHPLYQDICKEYGQNLLSDQSYEEAGIMFQRAHNYSEAITAYKKSGCWRKIVPLISKMEWSKEKINSFFIELGHDLRERKQYLDSATIFGEYVNNPEERFLSLCKAKAWEEALRIMSMSDIPGADHSLRFEIVNQHGSTLGDIISAEEQLNQHTSRLLVVRAEKSKRFAEEGDDLNNLPECDMFSDTSSIRGSTQSRSSGTSSRGSGRTYRSSKNKRKHERKLLSLKEGSPYEDLALIRALHELISKAYSYREEVRSLCVALLHYNLDTEAADLQNRLSILLKNAEGKKSDIWIPELAQNRAAALAALGPEGTSNMLSAVTQLNPLALAAAAEIDPHLCLPPVMPHVSWKLKVLM